MVISLFVGNLSLKASARRLIAVSLWIFRGSVPKIRLKVCSALTFVAYPIRKPMVAVPQSRKGFV